MKDKYFQLEDSILTVHQINCDNCSNSKRLGGYHDDISAMERFYEIGWRARKKTYCPECAKKKLKNKD